MVNFNKLTKKDKDIILDNKAAFVSHLDKKIILNNNNIKFSGWTYNKLKFIQINLRW